jgi:ABC-type multidrug transport system fused ATPase/permease subunit
VWTLRSLFAVYRWRILFTYILLTLENLLHLIQPWVLGWAINDLLQSSYRGLGVFAAQHLGYVLLSAWRRMYDIRAFTRIYTDLATQLVLRQRGRDIEVSRVATRSALSREIIQFFERDVPFVLQALYGVVGALVMLAVCDGVLVPFCLGLLAPVYLLSSRGSRKTFGLNSRLNDELEREVEVITRNQAEEVRDHYSRVAGWRIKLADWEALAFGWMELCILALLGGALVRCCTTQGLNVGQIFAVFGYILMFVGSLASVPQLVQQLSRLRDISRRMQVPGPEEGNG